MKQQLQQQWIKLSTKLDAMTLRERVLMFVAVTAAILFLIYTLAVQPMLERQKRLLAQIKQQQNQTAAIDMEIMAKAQGFVIDPDAPVRGQLQLTRTEIDRISAGLLAVQKGLVAPERIAPLLENLLRGHGKLRLMALKTLPVAGMNEAMATSPAPAPPAAAMPTTQPAQPGLPAQLAQFVQPPQPGQPGQPVQLAQPTSKPRELLYRHGVEIVLQGSYLDMITYMDALEALPVQLFWGKASLDAQQYPNSRLTLTLYTLSLDQKWMKL
jgi:MSHA biogenesis protein MshJ